MTAILDTAISAAGTYTGSIYQLRRAGPMPYIEALCTFTWGSGGTSVNAYVQTSIDKNTWVDVISFAQFANVSGNSFLAAQQSGIAVQSPTDGALPPNTIVTGLLYNLYWRVKYTVVGAYS